VPPAAKWQMQKSEPSGENSMRIQIQYFARVRELAGIQREVVELPAGSSTEDLVSLAVKLHPSLDEVEEIMHVIVNGTMVNASPLLREGDTVALVPPLCGG
jgi:molybdopterin converting factor subunit 1